MHFDTNLVTNIEHKGQVERRITGTVGIVIGILLGAAFLWLGINQWWRLFLFFPFLLGMVGFLQATNKTCVMHAAKGTCETSLGVHKIEDKNLVDRLRQKGKGIMYRSIFYALTLTIIFLLLL